MRRTVGFVLFTLGIVLIALSPLFRLYTLPRVLKAPLDTYSTSISSGTGTYFSTKVLKVLTDRPMQNVSTARGDVKDGSKEVAVYDYFSVTKDTSADGGVVDVSTDRYAFDRVTGEAVHCCGEFPRHEGYTLKLPFHVDRITAYPFWDGTLGAAPPATFDHEEELEGMKVYVFIQKIEPTIIGEPIVIGGPLAGLPAGETTNGFISYTATTTLWVEPFTGAIMKGASHATRTLQTGGNPLFVLADTNFTNSDASVKETADQIRSKVFQL